MIIRLPVGARLPGEIPVVLLALAGLVGAPARAGSAPAGKSSAPAAPASASRWQIFSNGNEVNGVAVHAGHLYAATGGGVVAWDLATGKVLKKWTARDGLLGNRAYALAVCPLPEPKLVVGTLEGLNLYDFKTGRWQSMTPATSEVAGASVTSLVADPERRTLFIGYGYAGFNVFDARANTWHHFATVNGLLSNHVEGMALTKGGRQLWLISPSGLSLLDARGIKAYPIRDIGVTTQLSGAVAADTAGNVWAITLDGLLVRGSRGKWRTYRAGEIPGYPLRARVGLASAPDGTLWFENSRGEICHFDPATSRCLSAGKAPSAGGENGLWVGPDGTLFLATDEGVKAFNPRRGGTWRSYRVETDALRSNHIRALAEDAAGAVWIATEAGAYTAGPAASGIRLKPVGKPEDGALRAEVHSLFPDPRGGMWMGTSSGAAYLDGTTPRWLGARDGLASDTVVAIARDGRGQMWFGTSRGISVWDGKAFRTFTVDEGVPRLPIHALLARGEVVWIGMDVFMLRFEGGRFERLDDDTMGVEFESIRNIFPYRNDSLVVGTSNGLGFIDGRTGRDDPEIYGDAIDAIALGADGELWVGTSTRGLFHRANAGWERMTTLDGLPSNTITAILVDRQGTIWVGTVDAGLGRYRR